jgi:hypothetical protein
MNRLVPLLLVVLPMPAAAEPMLKAGDRPDLDATVARHERQFYGLNAAPFGLSLDAHPKDGDALAAILAFVAQDASDDPKAVTGKHAFELIGDYGEHGDLGMFGGVPAAATAWRYLALKRDGADAATLATARARLVRAIESWHVFYEVTGGNGIFARGIRRLQPEDPADPPIPGGVPDAVPLKDGQGNPLPFPKDNGTWRADNSGGSLPPGAWMWEDSASKDQLSGQVFGMAAMYDAAVDDPDIDQSLVARMRQDALGVAKMLMVKREVSGFENVSGSGEYDLIIMDADGRPTYYHDLNPYSLEKFYLPPDGGTFNTFNLIMTLGIVKALHHVTGDPEVEQFLYVELLKNRDYLGMVNRTEAEGAVDYTYMAINTNFSDVNMIAVALWLAIHLENDPQVLAEYRKFLESRWWDKPGVRQTARKCKQAFFDAIYLGLTDRGTDSAVAGAAADRILARGLGPYLSPERMNCDAGELAAGSCVALDGKTVITLQDGTDQDGNHKATEALDPSIRPTSNYDSRSDPFDLNSGAWSNLNPGGDYLAAYWLLRWLDKKPAGQANVSPRARPHMPVGGIVPVEPVPEIAPDIDEPAVEPSPEIDPELVADAVVEESPDAIPADAAAETAPDAAGPSGGGCAAHAGASPGWLIFLVLLALSASALGGDASRKPGTA